MPAKFGLSPRMSRFDPESVDVGFVADKMVFGYVLFQTL
jgi:hypothetical protein